MTVTNIVAHVLGYSVFEEEMHYCSTSTLLAVAVRVPKHLPEDMHAPFRCDDLDKTF